MKYSRRTFLEAGLALPAVLHSAPKLAAARPASPGSSQDSSFDPWVEIHRDNLRHNVAEISRRVSGRPILAVIKNNGYGMGAVNIAQLLEPQPEIFGFAVVKLHEAFSLRDAGIRKPILLLGPFDEQNLADAVARGILPMVYTALGPVLDKIAATMMTFTEDPDFDQEQLRRFSETCTALEKEGIVLGRKHAASSFPLFQHPDAFFDMVRPGMAIYGIYSQNEFRHLGTMDLRPAISLKARVIYAKKMQKGDSAGYNRAYMAKDDVWVATVPVGHADGWPRIAAKGAKIRINGDLYPVIATVSASHAIIEIGSEEKVKISDTATFFDAQHGSRPEDVSESCGASVYDLTMHLNPLLPRRTV